MSSFRQAIALTIGAVLTCGMCSASGAQARRSGNVITPASGIEQPIDIGVRAHTHFKILVGPAGQGAVPFSGLGPAGGLSPAQLRSAYNLPSTGGSQIIAIVDAYDYPTALNDFNKFSSQFGLPQETSTNATASTNKVFQVLYQGGVKPAVDSTGGWELEEALDIEWSHAMAPGAKIVLVEAADPSFTNLLAAEDQATTYVDGNGQKVAEVSNSWGGSEFSGENTYDSHFTSTAVTYFVSAGDSGAPAEYPSASPNVISAGGTSVATNGSGAFTGETGWSSGGGGPSLYETTPSYQSGVASTVGAARGTPDISFDADPSTGVSVYDSYAYSGKVYGWLVLGGTSVSSPALAGIANLAATAAGSFPAGSVALLTNIYKNLGTSNFRDITSGNNHYAAKAGWDFVTGVGSCQGLAGLQNPTNVPTITTLSPASVLAGSGAFTLTVTGTKFVSGSTVNWNGTALTTTYVSATQLTASVPATDTATAGSESITVTNPGGPTSTAASFAVVARPVITSLSPSSTTAGAASFTLTVTGSGFTSSSAINWNGTALSTVFGSSTQLTATVAAASVATKGTASVTVVNAGPVTSNSSTFTINAPPTITSLSPGTATAGSAAFTLTVNGTGYGTGSVVHWGATTLTTTYVSATQVTAAVPAANSAIAGSFNVTVVNTGSVSSNAVVFTVTTPLTLTALSPASASVGSAAFVLTVTGTGFASGASIKWNGTSLTTTYISATQLSATIPAADLTAATTASITVANPSGAATAALAFSVLAGPVISSTTPSIVTAGGPAFTMTVTGSGFRSSDIVRMGASYPATTYVTPTTLQVAVPASYIATGQFLSVMVKDAGQVLNSNIVYLTVNNPAPTVTSMTPNSVLHGSSAININISGSNFIPSSQVQWIVGTKTTLLTIVAQTATSITATVPANLIATAGSASVAVSNPTPGGGTSTPVTFTIR